MWQSYDDNLAERLNGLADVASEHVVLVAPFITRSAFDQFISHISSSARLTVVTRWNVSDIVAGVSDPAIWESVQQRTDAKIFLVNNLHAKYFRFDSTIMVGSANITGRALGLGTNSNIELLNSLADYDAGLRFEKLLLRQAVPVDKDLYDTAIQLLADLPSVDPPSIQPLSEPLVPDDSWLPFLRHPQELWNVYSGDTESLTRTTVRNALSDLAMWDLPRGLDKTSFLRHVSMNLLHMPLIADIDKMLEESQRFGAVRDFIARQFYQQGVDRDANETWQSTIRWLTFFWPDVYQLSQPNISEIMVRKRP